MNLWVDPREIISPNLQNQSFGPKYNGPFTMARLKWSTQNGLVEMGHFKAVQLK